MAYTTRAKTLTTLSLNSTLQTLTFPRFRWACAYSASVTVSRVLQLMLSPLSFADGSLSSRIRRRSGCGCNDGYERGEEEMMNGSRVPSV
jgi:hypothetical protein